MHTILLFLAKDLIAVIGLAAFIYWLTLPKKLKIRIAVYGLITAVVAYGLAKLGGSFFYDTRPFVTDHVTALYPHGADNGFPSDHTLLSAVMAVTIFAASKKVGLALGVMAVLVGAARVIGHIHRPIDIAGSIVVAIIGGFVAAYLTATIQTKYTASK